MLHWLPLDSYPRVFAAARRVLKPGGWFHSESGGAGNVAEVTALLNEVADRFDLPLLPAFPDAGVALGLVEQAGLEVPGDGVRTIAQRRPFSRDGMLAFLRTQGPLVALTRDAPGDLAPEVARGHLPGRPAAPSGRHIRSDVRPPRDPRSATVRVSAAAHLAD